jgi:hypothetical protein
MGAMLPASARASPLGGVWFGREPHKRFNPLPCGAVDWSLDGDAGSFVEPTYYSIGEMPRALATKFRTALSVASRRLQVDLRASRSSPAMTPERCTTLPPWWSEGGLEYWRDRRSAS